MNFVKIVCHLILYNSKFYSLSRKICRNFIYTLHQASILNLKLCHTKSVYGHQHSIRTDLEFLICIIFFDFIYLLEIVLDLLWQLKLTQNQKEKEQTSGSQAMFIFWLPNVHDYKLFSSNRPTGLIRSSSRDVRCVRVCLSVCPFSRSIFWGLFCPHFPKSDVQNF